jgi:hypothetical protein
MPTSLIPPVPNSLPPRKAARRWRDLRGSTRIVVLLLIALLLSVSSEVLSRTYWALAKGVPFFHSERIWDAFFPETVALRTGPQTRDDHTYRVLLLGGSVVSPQFGDVGPLLETALEQRIGEPVYLTNLAYPGRTTLDSLLKYRRLGDHHFDLVVIYEGINDCYLNNCPPGVYRADYAHAPRYRQLRELERHKEVAFLAAPYTLWFLPNNAWFRLPWSSRPRAEWAHFGRDLHTPAAVEANLEEMIRIAQERGETVLLLSFAYDPSAALTEADRPRDREHFTPVSIWGEPGNVLCALSAHNEAIRRVAARHQDLTFVDVQQRMPTGGRYFNDICHLSAEGCAVFVNELLHGFDLRSR